MNKAQSHRSLALRLRPFLCLRAIHRLVEPILIRLLLFAALAAPVGGEQILESLPEAFEKTFEFISDKAY